MKKLSTGEILQAAKDLIVDPQHWTTGEFARDKYNTPVAPCDPEACKFCSVGAIARVASAGEQNDAIYALSEAIGSSPSEYNDTRGHGAVMAMFDTAIALTIG